MNSPGATQSSLLEQITAALECSADNPSVHISDIGSLEKKISILKSSANLLQDLLVITDFDYTLTKYLKADGERSDTAYRILLGSKFVGEEFNKRDEELANHFYPLETSAEISEEERAKICEEWWVQGNQCVLETKVSRDLIPQIVKSSGLLLRKGIDEMFHVMHSNQIPCLVFSAGLDSIINASLKEHKLLTPNVNVISNEMVWDEMGVVADMPGPTITSSNKNYKFLANYPQLEMECNPRKFVILLGDSPIDPNMIVGKPNIEVSIKIGFLNLNVSERLERYKELYDVVFTDDIPLHLFNKLLKLILN